MMYDVNRIRFDFFLHYMGRAKKREGRTEARSWMLNTLGRGVYVAPLFRATSSLGCLLVQRSRSNFLPFGSNLNNQIEQTICKPQLPNKNEK